MAINFNLINIFVKKIKLLRYIILFIQSIEQAIYYIYFDNKIFMIKKCSQVLYNNFNIYIIILKKF